MLTYTSIISPINNFRHYWNFFGVQDDFPSQLGGNCLFLVDKLRQSILSDVKLLQVKHGTHAAALINGSEFFDPCLLMQNSVSVEREFTLQNLDLGVSGCVQVSRQKINSLNLAWHVDLPNLQVSRSYFEFDVLNPHDQFLNDYHFELTREAPNMLFLRFVNLVTGFLNTVCYFQDSGNWFWTFHPYPASGYRLEVDDIFCQQFEESLGFSFLDFREICLQTQVLMNRFYNFRKV